MRYYSYQRDIHRTLNSKKRVFKAGFFHFSASCRCGLQASCVKKGSVDSPHLHLSSVFFSTGGILMESGCLWTLNSGESERETTQKTPKALFSCREPLIAWQYESFPQASTTTWPQMGVNSKDGSSGQTTEADSQPCQRDQTFGCQLGTQMDATFFFAVFFLVPTPPSPFYCKGTAAPLCCGATLLRQKEDKQIYLSSKKRRDYLLVLPLVIIIIALGITSCFVGLLCSINLSGTHSQGWWLTHACFFFVCFFYYYYFTGTKNSWGWFQLFRGKMFFGGEFWFQNTDKLQPQNLKQFPAPLWFQFFFWWMRWIPHRNSLTAIFYI